MNKFQLLIKQVNLILGKDEYYWYGINYTEFSGYAARKNSTPENMYDVDSYTIFMERHQEIFKNKFYKLIFYEFI